MHFFLRCFAVLGLFSLCTDVHASSFLRRIPYHATAAGQFGVLLFTLGKTQEGAYEVIRVDDHRQSGHHHVISLNGDFSKSRERAEQIIAAASEIGRVLHAKRSGKKLLDADFILEANFLKLQNLAPDLDEADSLIEIQVPTVGCGIRACGVSTYSLRRFYNVALEGLSNLLTADHCQQRLRELATPTDPAKRLPLHLEKRKEMLKRIEKVDPADATKPKG